MEITLNDANIFVSDDDAKLCFNTREVPETVSAFIIGKTSINCEERIVLELKNLTHLITVSCDEDLKKLVPWGSNANYSLYFESTRERMVIVHAHSGVNRFFFIDQAGVSACLQNIIRTIDASDVWVLLECIVGTYDKCYLEGSKHGNALIKKAFINNKLKKKKDPDTDTYKVYIER
jgi:hypothetical protein